MNYLLLGDDTKAKDSKIAQLKKKLFPAADSVNFDYEVLSCHKLDLVSFKQSLLLLPAIAQQRLIVLRQADDLSTQGKAILLDFFQRKIEDVCVIVDADEWDVKDSFVGKIKSFVQIIECQSAWRPGVFDMTNAVGARKTTEALEIMHDLIEEGEHPLQMMGALVWSWGKARTRLTPQKFKKGLLVLQEADSHIKRSRLSPENTLEWCVVKLCSL